MNFVHVQQETPRRFSGFAKKDKPPCVNKAFPLRRVFHRNKKNINFDNPSVICFANATSLYTREAMER